MKSKDLEQIFNQMDTVFKEVDKVFKEIEHLQINVQVARKEKVGPWKEWFAWRPVKIHGERVWLKKVYRRSINTYVDMDDWTRYEYGTVFDIIKDASK